MMIVTTDYITGKELEMLGFCKGSTVETVHAGKDIAASFKTLVGGEVKGYSELMEKSRKEAIARMVADAEGMGADAIVGARFASASIMQTAAEVLAYGTAVKFK